MNSIYLSESEFGESVGALACNVKPSPCLRCPCLNNAVTPPWLLSQLFVPGTWRALNKHLDGGSPGFATFKAESLADGHSLKLILWCNNHESPPKDSRTPASWFPLPAPLCRVTLDTATTLVILAADRARHRKAVRPADLTEKTSKFSSQCVWLSTCCP